MSDLHDYKDERGKFVEGNPGSGRAGPGRPKGSEVERLRQALNSVLDDATMEAWVRALRKKLARGSITASLFVVDRILGKPAVNVHHQVDGNLDRFVLAWQRASGDLGDGAQDAGDNAPALPAGGGVLDAGDDDQAA